MTTLRIVLPTDSLERLRFTARLERAGVSAAAIARGSVESSELGMSVVGGMDALVRAAAMAGNPTALDYGDLEYAPQTRAEMRAVPLPGTFDPSWPDDRVREDIAEIELGIRALENPNPQTYVADLRTMRNAFDKISGMNAMDLAQCSRAELERYRALLPRVEAALRNARDITIPGASSRDIESVQRSLDTATAALSAHAGRSVPSPRLSTGPESCSIDFWVIQLGCGRDLTLSHAR